MGSSPRAVGPLDSRRIAPHRWRFVPGADESWSRASVVWISNKLGAMGLVGRDSDGGHSLYVTAECMAAVDSDALEKAAAAREHVRAATEAA